jgi:hypothetical protein
MMNETILDSFAADVAKETKNEVEESATNDALFDILESVAINDAATVDDKTRYIAIIENKLGSIPDLTAYRCFYSGKPLEAKDENRALSELALLCNSSANAETIERAFMLHATKQAFLPFRVPQAGLSLASREPVAYGIYCLSLAMRSYSAFSYEDLTSDLTARFEYLIEKSQAYDNLKAIYDEGDEGRFIVQSFLKIVRLYARVLANVDERLKKRLPFSNTFLDDITKDKTSIQTWIDEARRNIKNAIKPYRDTRTVDAFGKTADVLTVDSVQRLEKKIPPCSVVSVEGITNASLGNYKKHLAALGSRFYKQEVLLDEIAAIISPLEFKLREDAARASSMTDEKRKAEKILLRRAEAVNLYNKTKPQNAPSGVSLVERLKALKNKEG